MALPRKKASEPVITASATKITAARQVVITNNRIETGSSRPANRKAMIPKVRSPTVDWPIRENTRCGSTGRGRAR